MAGCRGTWCSGFVMGAFGMDSPVWGGVAPGFDLFPWVSGEAVVMA